MVEGRYELFARAALIVILFVAYMGGTAFAGYGRDSESAIDLATLKINEDKYLGTKLNGEMALVDQNGIHFNLRDMFGKPLILILSYYTCDGACSTVNIDLRDVLAKTRRVEIGKD